MLIWSIKKNNNNKYGTAAALESQSDKIYTKPFSSARSVFCAGQLGKFNRGMVRSIIPESFKFLMGDLILETEYCFQFTILVGRGSPKGFHLAFLIIISLTPQVKKSM